MATRVLITVDTELAWRHHRAGLSWRENFERSYEAAGVGIPYQLARLAQHDLKACFFVDPMPALLFGIEPVRRMVDPILAAGQEIQLHLHSFWHDLAGGRDDIRFELTDFDAAGQRDLIATARDLLVHAGAPEPIAFRSGSYAANAATLDALRALGLRYDSSHNGSHHPWPSALPLPPGLMGPVACRGIVEIPVGQVVQRGGQLRHLQLCALSQREIEAALRHAVRHDHSLATLVSHSFELATRDGLRPNHTIRRRFDRLCAFLERHAQTMRTATFAGLDGIALEKPAHPLPVRRWLSTGRVVEQVWADARYERPATALTALSGSSTSSLELFVPLIGL